LASRREEAFIPKWCKDILAVPKQVYIAIGREALDIFSVKRSGPSAVESLFAAFATMWEEAVHP
jgi:hypothetical protein